MVEAPVLLWDADVVAARYRRMHGLLPGFDIRYAVKANPAAPVLCTLSNLGAGFDVASAPELALVRDLVAVSDQVVYSNPVKPARHIRAAHSAGVTRYAFDSEAELHKIATGAPASQVYVRLTVDDAASVFPLSRKFGVSIEEAERLLLLAGRLGLEPYGATFHVGSQCLDATAWARAIGDCGELMRRLQQSGIALRMLDIGGGFPAPYADPVPDLDEIACRVLAAVDELPYRPPALVAEPGRYLVAESGVLIASVLLVQERADGRWVFLDVSGYHGLMEALQTGGQWRFPVWTSADGQAATRSRPRSPDRPATAATRCSSTSRCPRRCAKVTCCSSAPPAPTRSATPPTSTASHHHSWWKAAFFVTRGVPTPGAGRATTDPPALTTVHPSWFRGSRVVQVERDNRLVSPRVALR